MTENLEGKIAAILNRTTVVINLGSAQDIDKGTEFYIYTKLGPFFDPDTRESLGETTKIWGKVQATIVEKRFCVAETKSYTNYMFISNIALESMFKSRVELPVDENDITKSVEKIQIGFPVMVVPKTNEIEKKDVLVLPETSSKDIEENKKKPRKKKGKNTS
jgi:hypothetical protein